MNRARRIPVVLAVLGVAPGTGAQHYPSRAVHCFVPHAPGGRVGAEQVSRAPPDGYTLSYTVGAELAMRRSRPGDPTAPGPLN